MLQVDKSFSSNKKYLIYEKDLKNIIDQVKKNKCTLLRGELLCYGFQSTFVRLRFTSIR